MKRWMGRAAALAVVVSMTSVGGVAQTGEGAKFYAEYSAALTKAKSVDELLPFLSKMQAARLQKAPESDKTMMLGLIQSLQPKAIKVLKESASGDGIVLEVTGTGEGGHQTGTVTAGARGRLRLRHRERQAPDDGAFAAGRDPDAALHRRHLHR